MASEFKVKIPDGYLIVEEKGAYDDYPGVFVSLCRDGEEFHELIACVEYDSVAEEIKTETYTKDEDEPNHIICFEDGTDIW